MAKINGTAVIFDVDGDPIAHIQDATLTINRETPDATTKDSGGWQEILEGGGLKDWEISFNGFADYASTGGNVEDLFDLIVGRTSTPIVWGPTNGDLQFSGNAHLGNVELGAPNEETATISGSAVGTSELSKVE